MDDVKADTTRKLTKILQRFPSDPSAGNLFTKAVLTAVETGVVELTELNVTCDNNDLLDKLKRENAEIRDKTPKSWNDFVAVAEAKGHKTLKDKAAAVGVDPAYLKTCKEMDRVPFALIQKLTDAPDESETSQLELALRRLSASQKRTNAVENALEDRNFLTFRLRHFDVPGPLAPDAAEKRPRSDMTDTEFREILSVLFPHVESESARCVLLSVLTGYTEFSHRSHAGLLNQGGAPRAPKAPSDELAKYLRLLRRREEAFQRGEPLPEPETKQGKGKNRARKEAGGADHNSALGAVEEVPTCSTDNVEAA
ncbi:hypothetical protein [Microvirga sp. G4-2]|uniref:hypothetical protein n=1 Tax=Microvirga sp. G4-2 TaxID=3434467 RepID=UPI0040446685